MSINKEESELALLQFEQITLLREKKRVLDHFVWFNQQKSEALDVLLALAGFGSIRPVEQPVDDGITLPPGFCDSPGETVLPDVRLEASWPYCDGDEIVVTDPLDYEVAAVTKDKKSPACD